MRGNRKVVIASDSSSALLSIQNSHSGSRKDILLDILQLASGLQKAGLKFSFLWVPAHIGVEGNELAKKAAGKDNIDADIKYSKAEVKRIIKTRTYEKWQFFWDNESFGRHLFSIQPKVKKFADSIRTRHEEVVLSRLRIGHTRLNSTLFLMKKHVDGNCGYCIRCSPETVEHVLIHCQKYYQDRQRLIAQVEANEIVFEYRNILQRNAGKIFHFLFLFLKNTGLLKRI
jgi:hypothetical protein